MFKKSLLIIALSIGLLAINKILTANGSAGGVYMSSLREPVMVLAYALLTVGILGLVVSLFKKRTRICRRILKAQQH